MQSSPLGSEQMHGVRVSADGKMLLYNQCNSGQGVNQIRSRIWAFQQALVYCISELLKMFAFVALSAGIIYISRASLRAPRSHGFYRFFAWEFIVALLLLNFDVWFTAPFAWHQLVSWFLLMICLVPLILGVHALTSQGKPITDREMEPDLLAFEKTTSLVTGGIYHYIRHPLYSSLLFLTWGIFFKALTWAGVFLSLAATLFLIATARTEEAECIRFFGPAYQAYMKQTKRFVPFLF
jgi:protein-S-isoprenylcysteine O-methyltransferase Ste14